MQKEKEPKTLAFIGSLFGANGGQKQIDAREQGSNYAKESAKPRIQQNEYLDEELAHLLVDLDGAV